MTHPSAVYNYGENPDQIRNSLTNCGVRKPQYGVEGTEIFNFFRYLVIFELKVTDQMDTLETFYTVISE